MIGGTENQIHLTTAAGADKRTIIKSTKGISIQWSRDYRHYAYAKDGNIFIASIDDKEPRQLTGKKSEPEKEKAESSDKPKDDAAKDADKDKKEKEKFNVVRLSP
ncbi:MAG TPA: hypothetical protein VN476_14580, partial [Pyrinomonadaceae bacterium]|nr:hypothetical protein [Pyrinomonadaceae bacterium]